MSLFPPKDPLFDPKVIKKGESIFKSIMNDCLRPPRLDPWAKLEGWRFSPPFTSFYKVRKMFPGLGIASVLFVIYLGLEWGGIIPDQTDYGHDNHNHHHKSHDHNN